MWLREREPSPAHPDQAESPHRSTPALPRRVRGPERRPGQTFRGLRSVLNLRSAATPGPAAHSRLPYPGGWCIPMRLIRCPRLRPRPLALSGCAPAAAGRCTWRAVAALAGSKSSSTSKSTSTSSRDSQRPDPWYNLDSRFNSDDAGGRTGPGGCLHVSRAITVTGATRMARSRTGTRCRTHSTTDDDLFWFRRGDDRYLVTDPAALERLAEIFKPAGGSGPPPGRAGAPAGRAGPRSRASWVASKASWAAFRRGSPSGRQRSSYRQAWRAARSGAEDRRARTGRCTELQPHAETRPGTLQSELGEQQSVARARRQSALGRAAVRARARAAACLAQGESEGAGKHHARP